MLDDTDGPPPRAGMITFQDCVLVCSIESSSDHGAGLTVSVATAIPEEFVLEDPVNASRHFARLAWRDGGHLGVHFADSSAPLPFTAA